MNFDGTPFTFGGGGGGGGGGTGVTLVDTDSSLTGGPITATGTLGISAPIINSISGVVTKTQHMKSDASTTTFDKSTAFIIGPSNNLEVVTDGGFPLLLVGQTGVRIEQPLITDDITPFSDGSHNIGSPAAKYNNAWLAGNLLCSNLESDAYSFNEIGTLATATAAKIRHMLSDATSTTFDENSIFTLGTNNRMAVTTVSGFPLLKVDPDRITMDKEMVTNAILPSINNAYNIGIPASSFRSLYLTQNVFCADLTSTSYSFNQTAAQTYTNQTNIGVVTTRVDTVLQRTSTLTVAANGTSVASDLIVTGDVSARNLLTSQYNFNAIAALATNNNTNIAVLEQKTSTLNVIGLVTNIKNLNVETLNGRSSLTGGMFLQVNECKSVTGTAEQTLFNNPTATLGQLAFPANVPIGAYRISLNGKFQSSTNNLTLRLKNKKNNSSLCVFVMVLTGSTDEHFECAFDITVRGTGADTLLSVHGHFTYSDGPTTDYRGDLTNENGEQIDGTTITPLDVTAQFSSSIATNVIQIQQAVMTQVY